jgi:two-component system response regulator QseB
VRGISVRLLLVEDDAMIGESIEEGLRSQAYAVDWVRDGVAADVAMRHTDYDLMLLDLGLPGKQGMDVLRSLRAKGNEAAVLIITARDSTQSRVEGLDSGADDYLVKPFDLDELFARVRALLRRRAGRSNALIQHGALTLDLARHEVTFEGKAVHLAAREFAVLRALLDQPGAVLSKAQLESKLYSWNGEIESNAIDVYIHHLRKKLGADFIKNIRGVGFKIAAVK